MKVILRADVENLGSLGDVVDVRPGYGRNFLLPQGIAMLVTEGNLKVFELERKKLEAKMAEVRAAAASLGERISAAPVRIVMRVGENDKLYGSVTTAMISEALAAQEIEVDRRRILLDGPIRSLGEHQVRVRLHADMLADLTVIVEAEERFDEAAAAEAPAAEEPAAEEAVAE
ncbi:MAG: 50S ribosomal protein L9 [Desulfovibrionaceae bacterium]|nr:50S ribosomal protein L9 [Desulfovibrionaceae bacterium]